MAKLLAIIAAIFALVSVVLATGNSIQSLETGCKSFVAQLSTAGDTTKACLSSYYKMKPALKAYEEAVRQFGGKRDFDSIEKDHFISQRMCQQ